MARWRYRRDWRIFVYSLRRLAKQGHTHALAELRRLEPDPDPWREQGLRAAAAVQLMFMRDYDPSQIISDADLDQLVNIKLATWQAGIWEGKKGLRPLPLGLPRCDQRLIQRCRASV